MNEYIKCEDAIELVYKAKRAMPIQGVLTDTMSWAIALVNEIPSADVVEVVRCKDCWKRPFDNCWLNEYVGLEPDDDFYCADGERRSSD